MKKIQDIANVACIERAREEKQKNYLDPICTRLVDKIFVKFSLLCREYDSLYADPKRENAEKLQWTLAFTKHGIRTQGQIQYALDQTEFHKYGRPPQLGQFLEWCKSTPKAHGFPSLEEAYLLSIRINRQFSDYEPTCQKTYTVIRHAINQIGSMTYREMKSDKAKKAFETYYAISCNQWVEGKLEEIPKAITQNPERHPDDKQKSDLARHKAMEALRSMGIAIRRPVQEDYISDGH